MTDNPMVARNKEARGWQFKVMVLLHNPALCGMTHRVTIMMLLLDSTTMEIQVYMGESFPDANATSWSFIFNILVLFACLLMSVFNLLDLLVKLKHPLGPIVFVG